MPLFDWLSSDRGAPSREAFSDLQTMLDLGSEMFAAATAHLLDNEILDLDLESMDNQINQREAHLRSVVLVHLSKLPDREWEFTLRLFSVVQEAERIGDLAKSIAKTSELAKGPRMGAKIVPLRELRDRIWESFGLTRTSFRESDSSQSDLVLSRHVAIKRDALSLIARIADSSVINTREAVVFSLAVRMMARTSSHLANIASTISLPFDQIRRSSGEQPPAIPD